MVVVRDVYRRKRLAAFIGNGTANYGRITVPTKRTLHGPFTTVVMPDLYNWWKFNVNQTLPFNSVKLSRDPFYSYYK